MRWLIQASVLWLAVACEPGVGSDCDPNEARCLNESTELVCQDGKYIATPCRGPGGCAVLPTVGVACDITKNQPGDACATTEAGVASCVSDHRMIVCRNQKYAFEPCRGKNGCENSRGRALCDKSLAQLGDPCKSDGEKACDLRGRELLVCHNSKMASLYRCLGPRGCQSKGKLGCDMSVADKGDACAPEMEGAAACTPDQTGILACKGGKFVRDEDCKQGQSCTVEGAPKCEKTGP